MKICFDCHNLIYNQHYLPTLWNIEMHLLRIFEILTHSRFFVLSYKFQFRSNIKTKEQQENEYKVYLCTREVRVRHVSLYPPVCEGRRAEEQKEERERERLRRKAENTL